MGAGAAIHTGSPADAIESAAGRWNVRSGRWTVTCAQVLVATNGYSGALIPDLSRSILPAHSIQIATEPLPPDLRAEILPAGLPVSDSRRLLRYFRLDGAGRFLIGARGSFGAAERGAHFAALRQAAERIFPPLREVRWTHRWSGKVALTLDHLPHVHNPAQGLYAALGYNGRGVAMASRAGVLLARLCLGMPHGGSPLPVRPVVPVPLHALRRPAMEVSAAWYRLLDRLES